jgi:Leucine-rich repeat (LRR) protein
MTGNQHAEGSDTADQDKQQHDQTQYDAATQLIFLSIFAFVVSLPLPVVPLPILGVAILLQGMALPCWWANPFLFAAWICWYRQWRIGLTACSIAALALALTAFLITDRPPFFLGFYAWLISLICAALAGLIAPTTQAWKALSRFLAHPRLTLKHAFILQFAISIPLIALGFMIRRATLERQRQERVAAYRTIMRINQPSYNSFPGPHDVTFSETALHLAAGFDADLQHLNRFSRLDSLELSSQSFTDQGLRELRQVPQLKSLVLRIPQLTPVGLRETADLKHLHSLTIVGGAAIDDDCLRHIGRLTSLRSLVLEQTQITGSGLGHLAGLPHLETLFLRGNSLTNDGLTQLHELAELKTLSLSGAQLSDRLLESVAKLPKLRRLVWARNFAPLGNVNYEQQTISNDDSLRSLRSLQNLRSLEISAGHVTDSHLSILSDFYSLEELKIDDAVLTEKGLAALGKLGQLRELHLTLRNVLAVDLPLLASCPQLTSLSLVNSSDAHLLAMGRLTKLQVLKVSGDFTDHGMAGLVELRRLEHLSLHGNFTDEGVQHLKSLVLLQELYLGSGRGNSRRLTDGCLGNLKGLKRLSNLHFNGTKVTDKGVKELKRSLSRNLSISRIN